MLFALICLFISDFLLSNHYIGAPIGTVFQFERLGYYNVDTDTSPLKTVFNRTIALN